MRYVLKFVLFLIRGHGKERFGEGISGTCQDQVTVWMKNSEITRIIWKMLG